MAKKKGPDGKDWEPENLHKYPLPHLKLRTSLSKHSEVKNLVPFTGIKAKIRTLLPEDN